ncbi:MAG: dipicolinate synthase subunit DpsA [Thermacetogeniaceae bacterium]
MGIDLTGISIAVIGGDRRHLVLMPELVRLGARVRAAGFTACDALQQVELVDDLEAAVANAQVLILPVQGTDPEGNIRALASNVELRLTPSIARLVPTGTILIIGAAREFMRNWATAYGWKLLEIMEMDDVAILNAIPSAEGAIQIAMEQLPITVHGSQSFVLGFGRVGKTLARMLGGIGAKTTIAARKSADLARIFEMGWRPVPFSQLQDFIHEAEIIFNTVPQLVLDEKMLSLLRQDTLIVDLAAYPGGTDFKTAKKQGIAAILSPGLPGKVAPATSGKILAQVVPPLILRELPQCYLRG